MQFETKKKKKKKIITIVTIPLIRHNYYINSSLAFSSSFSLNFAFSSPESTLKVIPALQRKSF